MDKKLNDFVVALVENPDFGMQNFKDVGLTADNTGFLDKESYKKSLYIQDKFSEDGKFNEAAFNNFYNGAASLYLQFANDEFEQEVFSDTTFDPFDALRPEENTTKLPTMDIIRVNNPDRLKTSISRVGRTDNREWTVSELALKEKVYDYKNKEWKDYSPNDRALENTLGGFLKSVGEPLVIALWEEDGEHVDYATGRKVKHSKGDYKYNDDGYYYYETLGGREVYGKQVKSIFDSFTVDGSKANKYDFFDSDGLDKSVAGTIAKTVATLTPLFVPGVNAYYGAALVGANLLDILPGIYKSTLGLNDTNTPILNWMLGVGRSFQNSTSEYSLLNLLTAENFFNLVTDVALQWSLQRAIFNAYHKLMGTNKLYANAAKAAELATVNNISSNLEKGILTDPKSVAEMANVIQQAKLEPLLAARNRTAANAALGYMAVLSGLDSFETSIEQGADRLEASMVAWGTIAGMYGIDRTGIGEIFFPELRETGREAANKAVRAVGEEVTKGFLQVALVVRLEPKKKKLAKLFDWSKKKSKEFWNGVLNHSLTFTLKAIGEGLEEVGEELVSDFVKSTFNLASEFGFTKTKTKLDAWENMAERYGMSFFGGALGGAIFAGVDISLNNRNSELLNQELIYLVRNGKKSELLDELEGLRKKNKLGNKNLSATKYEVDLKDNSKLNWVSPTDVDDNLNEATYRMIKSYINSLDATINQEGLNYTDNELLDKMVMGDLRMKALMGFSNSNDNTFGPLIANGYLGKLLNDWNMVASDILHKEGEILQLNKKYDDKTKRNSPEYLLELTKLLNEKNELLAKRDKFLDGSYSKHYTEQMLFAIDSNINGYFFTPTFKEYAEYLTKLEYDNIPEALKAKLIEDYEVYKKGDNITNLDTAYNIFKELNTKHSKEIGETGDIYAQFKELRSILNNELINLKATFERLTSVASGNIETIEDTFRRTGFTLSVKPVINDSFLQIEFRYNNNLTLSENDKIKNDINTHNIEALLKLSGIVDRIKLIGYIDSDTKALILSALNNPISKQYVSSALESGIYDEGILDMVSTVSPLTDASEAENVVTNELINTILEFLDDIKSILETLTPNNETEVKLKIEEAFKNDSRVSTVINSLMKALNESNAFASDWGMEIINDNEELKLNRLINGYNRVIDNALSLMKINDTLMLASRLKKDITSIRENPVHNLLLSFSINMYGLLVKLLDMLAAENTKLESLSSLSEYLMDSTKLLLVDLALNVINAVLAVTDAASTVELTPDNPYGHNVTINRFLLEHFPEELLYGIIPNDLAELIRLDLGQIKNKLLFLKELSNINAVNQFAENKKTGKTITKLLYQAARGKGEYAFLKDLKYNGKSLLDGLDNIQTPLLDSDSNEDGIYNEYDKIADLIYENYQAMKLQGGDPLVELFKDIKTKFSELLLRLQAATNLNSRTDKLSNYDLLINLATLIALKRSDFNYYLREVLNEPDVKFAPLFSQEFTAQTAVAMLVNPDIFNKILDLVEFKPDELGGELVKYYNTIMINGIGGAGKTSVVAQIINRINKKLNVGSEIYKVGPTNEQVAGLNVALGQEGKGIVIEDLIKQIIGANEFAELLNDIKNKAKKSKFYDTISHKIGVIDNEVAVISGKILLSNAPTPKIVFIDEATHINSIYWQILSKWALSNNILIVAMGDNYQNGYSEPGGITNIDPSNSMVVRTPKLAVSMRVTNRQKKDNIDVLLAIFLGMRILDFIDTAAKLSSADEVLRASEALANKYRKDLIEKGLILKYYLDENNPLNGELIAKTLDVELLKKMLANKEVGYVYNDVNSPTYKVIQDFITQNPNEGKRIKIYTPKEVQGSEKDYFIIDTKWNVENTVDSIYDFMKAFYTLSTRSKSGTVFIDNGLSNIIPEANRIREIDTSVSQDPENIIKDYRENKLLILDSTLLGYTPTLLPTNNGLGNNSLQGNGSSNNGNGLQGNNGLLGNNLQQGNGSNNNGNGSSLQGNGNGGNGRNNGGFNLYDFFNSNGEAANNNNLKDPIDNEGLSGTLSNGTIDGIRAYGWYMRYGVRRLDNGTIETVRRLDGVLEDLNVFLSNSQYDESLKAEIEKAKELLNTVRTYLTFGMNFDADFASELLSSGLSPFSPTMDAKTISDIWNNGEFKVIVRSDSSKSTNIADKYIDLALDKVGFNLDKVEEVAFNIIYRVKNGDLTYEFTIGKLPNPNTWQEWINKLLNVPNTIKETVKKYLEWYKKLHSTIQNNPDLIIYFNIPKEKVKSAQATRLKEVVNKGVKTLFSLDEISKTHPHIISSPLYIYSGQTGLYDDGTIKSGVKGKGVIFVTSNTKYKMELNGVMTKVSSDNIADMYVRLQQLRAEAKANGLSEPPPIIRMVIVDPKGMYIGNDYNSESGTIRTRGFLDLEFEDITREERQLTLSLVGSNTTAMSAILALWNYRVGLTRFINNGHANGFILKESGGYPMGIKLQTTNLGKINAVTITMDEAKALKMFLDEVFNLLTRVVNLPTDPNLLDKFMSTSKGSNGKLSDSKYSNMVQSLLSGEGTLNLEVLDENGNSKFQDVDYNGGGATKVMTILSGIFKLYNSGDRWNYKLYKIYTTNSNNEKVTLDLQEFAFKMGEIMNLTSVNSPSTFITNTLNMILHGRINPYWKAEDGSYPANRTWAPFPNGIYYHARYLTHNTDSPINDFYPCKNPAGLFTFDVAIEHSNFEISIDLNLAAESELPVEVKKTKLELFNLGTLKLRNNLSGLSIDIEALIVDALNKYDKEGDASYDNIVRDLFTNILNKLLNNTVYKGKEYNKVINVDDNFNVTTVFDLLTNNNINTNNVNNITYDGNNVKAYENNGTIHEFTIINNTMANLRTTKPEVPSTEPIEVNFNVETLKYLEVLLDDVKASKAAILDGLEEKDKNIIKNKIENIENIGLFIDIIFNIFESVYTEHNIKLDKEYAKSLLITANEIFDGSDTGIDTIAYNIYEELDNHDNNDTCRI